MLFSRLDIQQVLEYGYESVSQWPQFSGNFRFHQESVDQESG